MSLSEECTWFQWTLRNRPINAHLRKVLLICRGSGRGADIPQLLKNPHDRPFSPSRNLRKSRLSTEPKSHCAAPGSTVCIKPAKHQKTSSEIQKKLIKDRRTSICNELSNKVDVLADVIFTDWALRGTSGPFFERKKSRPTSEQP